MQRIRCLRHGVHNHLERYNHARYEHVINTGSDLTLYTCDKPCSHRTEDNHRQYRKYRDKQRISDAVKEMDLRQSVYIVFQSYEAIAIREHKRSRRNVQLVFQGVHDYEENRNQERNCQNGQNDINNTICNLFSLFHIILPPLIWSHGAEPSQWQIRVL